MAYNKYVQALMFCSSEESLDLFLKLCFNTWILVLLFHRGSKESAFRLKSQQWHF